MICNKVGDGAKVERAYSKEDGAMAEDESGTKETSGESKGGGKRGHQS
jgi:hypothetical protein